MTDKICEFNKCTGCSVCAVVCPKQCIEMKPDAEGFLHPNINANKCISCGLCMKTCPVRNEKENDCITPTAYAFQHSDERIRLSSSSGGAFSAIAELCLNNGGAVFGAAFVEGFKVQHICCENIEQLAMLQGSKYVQSDISDSLPIVKQMLKDKRKVLFTGTPCQIAAVKAAVGKDEPNLSTVDLVCHGVPSPKAWEDYIKEREKAACAQAQRIAFRRKNSGWKQYSVQFVFDNGTEYCKKVNEDAYMRAFVGHVMMRESCHHCSFKDMHRQADLTLADLWGIERVAPEFNDDKGTTLVLAHTENGRKMIEALSHCGKVKEVDFESAIISNQSYLHSAKKAPYRDAFQKTLTAKGMEVAVEKFFGHSIDSKVRRVFYKLQNARKTK